MGGALPVGDVHRLQTARGRKISLEKVEPVECQQWPTLPAGSGRANDDELQALEGGERALDRGRRRAGEARQTGEVQLAAPVAVKCQQHVQASSLNAGGGRCRRLVMPTSFRRIRRWRALRDGGDLPRSSAAGRATIARPSNGS